MEKIIQWAPPHTISLLVKALKNNELVAGTTDTILGLLAPLTHDGFEKLNAVKGRQEKPYLILLSSAEKIPLFVDVYPGYVQPLLDACWPGPLTILLKAKKSLAPHLVSKEGTIALRVPHHVQLLELLHHFDGLFSTSANLSGQPVATTVDQMDIALKDAVSYVVTGGSSGQSLASTIIDCTKEKIKVIRHGAYDVDYLKQIIGADFFE